MKISINVEGKNYFADLTAPIDISITTNADCSSVAWFVENMKVEPVINDRFVGSVKKGGDVNFRNLLLNPHGNCTHTESVGHISKELYSVHNILDRFHFLAQLITISPTELGKDTSKWMKKGDAVITLADIKGLISEKAEALVIRTTPNSDQKRTKNYNNTNWPYIAKEAAEYIREMNIKHLLIDLPSVDKEEDGGLLVAHRAYWNYPNIIDLKRTITEFIYVPDFVKDGMYILNLSIANIDNDASPSRPVLYNLSK